MADTPQDAETAAREAPGVCGICRTPLNIPGRVWTEDCGGDCLACMADAGDPDCVAALRPASSPGEVTVTDAMVDAVRAELRRAGYPAIFASDMRAALTASLLSTTQTESP